MLFHVNGFTATYLGPMLEELRRAFEAASRRQVVFEVPVEYLLESSRGKDLSLVEMML